ncbi:MAG: TolC family protein [Acidobacteriota bacterium]
MALLFATFLPALLHAAGERPDPRLTPAQLLLAEVQDVRLAGLLREVLDRNPGLAALEARVRSVAERPAQARSLPDPNASVTAYLETPETRVGPQRATLTLSQKFPWFGKRGLRERAAVHEGSAARAHLESTRLERLTQARVYYHEIGFLDTYHALTGSDRDTLRHFEELARARYASGIGLQQDVLKVQTEITRVETKLLRITEQRARAVAALNALRNHREGASIETVPLPDPFRVALDRIDLEKAAVERRPEMERAAAEIERAATLVALARKDSDPDITLGVNYGFVGSRDDPAAGLASIEDDGQDILGISVGLNLPVRRARRTAQVREAVEQRAAVEGQKEQLAAQIRRSVEELAARIPLIWSQLRLFDDVLVRQSEESLRLAVSAYATGSVNALDLLDAERILLEARTAGARARADYLIAVARLEGVIARPLDRPAGEGGQSHAR